jgi:hypothetical protein
VGGQTGEERGGGESCFEGEPPIDLPDSDGLGAQLAGTYRVPVFWVGDDRLGEYVDPSEVASTQLKVEMKRREGPARGYEACGEMAWVPVDIDVSSEDGSLKGRRAAWLQISDRHEPDWAQLRAGLNARHLELDGGHTLLTYLEASELRGHVVGRNRIGYLRTTCGDAHGASSVQLPLSERPSDASFPGVPPPAELFDAIDGHAFDIDWGGGHRAELFAKVRSRSQHACWEDAGPFGSSVTWGGEVELADAHGVRIAAARVNIGVRPCASRSPTCFEFVVGGAGSVHKIGEGEPIPDLGFDDGGAWVSDWALGIVSFDALTGGAASFEEGWQWGQYDLTAPVAEEQLGTPTLEIMVHRGSLENALWGRSAP